MRHCANLRFPARVLTASFFVLAAVAQAQAEANISRPSPEAGPTRVEVSILVLDVDEVNAANQSFTSSTYFLIHWKDPRLAHGGASTVVRPLDAIWNPRLQFINQQDLRFTFPEIVEISPEGDVVYRQRVWGSFSQPLKLRDFPFDRQQLNILVAAADYRVDEVALVPFEAEEWRSGIAPEFSLPDWQVLGWRAERTEYRVFRGEPGAAAFRFSIEIRRYSGYFILKIILPLSLIVAMSWIAFWLDPTEVGTKISTIIMAMLTLVAYRFALVLQLPKVAYETRMDSFVLMSMLLVFAGLPIVAAEAHLVRAESIETAHSLDRWARFLFPAAFLALALWILAY